jgi:translation initiation factor 3 subunit M
MQSVIIVEQELKDSTKGYGQILDTANENKGRSESFDKYIDQEGKITDKDGLSNEIFESIVDLAKLSDKEFEPTFNLAVYILIELTGSMTEVLDK